MTNKVSTKDWRNLPIKKWNVTTIHAFLIDETRRRYDAEYKPGGRGSLSQRWAAEKGMIKRELTKHGPEVVRKFIEVCWREYYPNDRYRFPTFGFMIAYQDRYWTDAIQEVESDEIVKRAEKVDVSSVDEAWF